MSYAKLRGKIREKFETQENFASALGMSYTSLSHRLSGKLEFKSSEIMTACDLLGIEYAEAPTYFFIHKV